MSELVVCVCVRYARMQQAKKKNEQAKQWI